MVVGWTVLEDKECLPAEELPEMLPVQCNKYVTFWEVDRPL